MKKADVSMFANYLEYKRNMANEKIKTLTEEDFKSLVYLFDAEEGYTFDGGYEAFLAYVNKLKVHIGYAGITFYAVYRDGIEVYYGWSEAEILERFGVAVDDMERI